jgi:hypothetical protein
MLGDFNASLSKYLHFKIKILLTVTLCSEVIDTNSFDDPDQDIFK